MSSTEPTSTSPLSVPPTTMVVNNSPSAWLGKNAFLQLLVTQMKDQDPTSPTDSSAFMSQLAQFSSLEQMTNMSDSLTTMSTTSAVTQGVDLIGRNLTWSRDDGSTGTGIAQSVTIADGSVVVDVGGEQIQEGAITSVGQPPANSSGQAPATGSTQPSATDSGTSGSTAAAGSTAPTGTTAPANTTAPTNTTGSGSASTSSTPSSTSQ